MRGRPQPGPLNMLGLLEVSPSGVRIQRGAWSHTQYQSATGFRKCKGSGGQSVCTPESRWDDSQNTHAQATPNLRNQNLCVGDHTCILECLPGDSDASRAGLITPSNVTGQNLQTLLRFELSPQKGSEIPTLSTCARDLTWR